MSWTPITTYTPGSPATPPASSTDWQNYLTNNLAALMPVGAYQSMHATPGSSGLVNGCYLECNGQAVSRTTYATLYALIGTTYGAGDGSSTFNVPDAAGRTLVAAAGTGGNSDVTNLGQTDGHTGANRAARHTHTLAETAHTHTGSIGVNSTDDTHTHSYSFYGTDTLVGYALPSGPQEFMSPTTVATTTAGGHGHSFSSLTASSDSGGVTVGVGTAPVDGPAYTCAGTLFIKAL